jgi:hypothetical protein
MQYNTTQSNPTSMHMYTNIHGLDQPAAALYARMGIFFCSSYQRYLASPPHHHPLRQTPTPLLPRGAPSECPPCICLSVSRCLCSRSLLARGSTFAYAFLCLFLSLPHSFDTTICLFRHHIGLFSRPLFDTIWSLLAPRY